MKPYEQLDNTIKAKLQMICDEDPYSLRPQTLYTNIACSSGSDETLASLFEVPLTLVQAIKEANHANR